MRKTLTGEILFVFFLLACLFVSASALRAETKKPNIILITVDGLRTDALGCYGAEGNPSPAVDRLASQGIRVRGAYSVDVQTLPAHASLLTSLRPFETGVRADEFYVLRSRDATLPGVLREEAGYRTAAFISSFDLDSHYGLDKGFDLYDDDLPYKTAANVAIAKPLRPFERKPADTNQLAMAWLKSSGSSPFFLWIHFSTFNPPGMTYSLSNRMLDRKQYAAGLATIDQQVGELFSFLQGQKLAENLLIVLTSPYGESIRGEGEKERGQSLADSTIHVPLVFWSSRLLPKPAAAAFEMSLIDVAPTILEMAGVSVPASMKGESRYRLLKKGKGSGKTKSMIYAETFLPWFRYGLSELRAVQEGGFKYVHSPTPALYDLGGNDGQGEKENLHDPDNATEKKLRAGLLKMLGENEKERRAAETFESPVGGERKRSPSEAGEELDSLAEAMDLLTSKQLRAAADIVDKVCKEHPFDVYALIFRSEIAFASQDAGETESSLRKALAAMEKLGFPEAAMENPRLKLATVLEFQNKHDEAVKLYEAVFKVNPSSVVAGRSLFQHYRLTKDTEGMIRHLKGMIERDPHDVEAMHALAVTYYDRKNLEGARRLLEEAIAAGGDKNIEVFILLMDVLKDMEKYREAVQYCELGLAANPGKWKRLRLVEGIMHLNLDEEAQARQDFEQVKDEYVLETEAHQALGEWLQAKGRYKEAYQELTLAAGDRQHASDIEKKLKELSDLIQKQEGGDNAEEKQEEK